MIVSYIKYIAEIKNSNRTLRKNNSTFRQVSFRLKSSKRKNQFQTHSFCKISIKISKTIKISKNFSISKDKKRKIKQISAIIIIKIKIPNIKEPQTIWIRVDKNLIVMNFLKR